MRDSYVKYIQNRLRTKFKTIISSRNRTEESVFFWSKLKTAYKRI